MENIDRYYRLHRELKLGTLERHSFIKNLEISRATFRRDLEYLRSRFNANVEYNKATGRYQYTNADLELPGLWLTDEEINGLMVMDAFLADQGHDLLAPALNSLRTRIADLRGVSLDELKELTKRVRSFPTGRRLNVSAILPTIAQATLERFRLSFDYHARYSDEVTRDRTVSPQRLSFYRNNWYLTAWCHLREELRTFALDRMSEVHGIANAAALDVAWNEIDVSTKTAFGIISSTNVKTAKLWISAAKSRWVLDEIWHEQQQQGYHADGSAWRELPYSHPFEIVAEVLRHGGEVQVLEPPELRAEVQRMAAAAAAAHKPAMQ